LITWQIYFNETTCVNLLVVGKNQPG